MAKADVGRERRAEILAAVIRALARDGIGQTTTRGMAAEASINQATLRYYFGSKDDVLLAVLHEMMRLTREIAQAAAHSERGLLRAAIRESLTAFWQHVEAAPELQVMQYELTIYALRRPESAWLAQQQYDGYRAVVETLLRDAFAAADQPCAIPFADLARFVVGGLDGLILQFVSARDVARARRDLTHLIAAVIALAEGASAESAESVQSIEAIEAIEAVGSVEAGAGTATTRASKP